MLYSENRFFLKPYISYQISIISKSKFCQSKLLHQCFQFKDNYFKSLGTELFWQFSSQKYMKLNSFAIFRFLQKKCYLFVIHKVNRFRNYYFGRWFILYRILRFQCEGKISGVRHKNGIRPNPKQGLLDGYRKRNSGPCVFRGCTQVIVVLRRVPSTVGDNPGMHLHIFNYGSNGHGVPC